MRMILALLVCFIASFALAHQGVQNPAVMARMNGMSAIADATKILTEVSRGARPLGEAEAARVTMIAEAERIDALFKAQENDPKSEALPAIWTDFPKFSAIATDLANAATALETTSPESIAAGLPAIGATCRACHKDYRLP